jgi:hypothetical protein
MTARAIEEKKSKPRPEETFDFPETDLCDFGYVLAVPADTLPSPAPTVTPPSK